MRSFVRQSSHAQSLDTGTNTTQECSHPNAPMGVSQRHEYGARPRRVDSVIKPKRPATYDGKSSCRDYLVQFEMIAELNRWDAPTRDLELATSLRGLALAILSDLGPKERGDYNKLLRALVGRFEPDNQSEVFRSQLKGRQRRKGETKTKTKIFIQFIP